MSLRTAFIFWTTASGVPAGANRPIQTEDVRSRPLSFRVGTVDNTFTRCGVATATATALPDWMCGMAAEIDAMPRSTCPPATAVAAGAAPGYGMWLRVTPPAKAIDSPRR
jgi:hypothetical protein